MRLIFSIVMLVSISIAGKDTPRMDLPFLLTENDLSGRVAWVSDSCGDSDIFYMDLNEGEASRICSYEGEDIHPAMSPDGWSVAWVTECFGQPDIMLVYLGPYGNTRCPVRLTDSPGTERDLNWFAGGEKLQFSVLEAPDLESISLFFDPSTLENEIIEEVSNLYYCRTVTGDIEHWSLEPGNYRHPCHVSGFGTICAWWAWERGALARLVYIHNALVTSDYITPGDEVVGPIRRYPNGDILVPCQTDGQLCYFRMVPETGEIVSEFNSSWNILNPVPDPVDSESGWYICQTGLPGDPCSEIILIRGLEASDNPLIIPLTQNDCYDGEPSWAMTEMIEIIEESN